MANRDDRDSGLQLDQFTKSCPPGWKPGIAKYPLRRYFQLIGLWWRQTELQEHCMGPAVAGRLRGAAFQFALSLSADRLDIASGVAGIRRIMTGDELLSQQSHDAFTDGQGIAHPAEAAGGSVLLRALQREYGMEDQDLALVSLDAFFQHARGSGNLGEYMTMFNLCFNEAQAAAGLAFLIENRSPLESLVSRHEVHRCFGSVPAWCSCREYHIGFLQALHWILALHVCQGSSRCAVRSHFQG